MRRYLWLLPVVAAIEPLLDDPRRDPRCANFHGDAAAWRGCSLAALEKEPYSSLVSSGKLALTSHRTYLPDLCEAVGKAVGARVDKETRRIVKETLVKFLEDHIVLGTVAGHGADLLGRAGATQIG